MKIIALLNNKGGVSKTTVTQNLAIALSKQGKKVGMIDFDSQANLSLMFPGVGGNFIKEKVLQQQTLKIEDWNETTYKDVWILPNDKDIRSSIFEEFSDIKKLYVLKKIVQGVDYLDYIFIDTPPTLELPVLVTMVASDYIMIPINCEKFSVAGLVEVYSNVAEAKEINPDLYVLGVLVTKLIKNEKGSDELLESLHEELGDGVFRTIIRKSDNYKNSQQAGIDVFQYESQGIKALLQRKGTDDFNALAKEVIMRTQQQ
jgi:chromosome partitioning protein